MTAAAPASPKARASESPMISIISAPATASSTCACSIDGDIVRSPRTWRCTPVMTMPMTAALASLSAWPAGRREPFG
jgi:hypothetical protein